MCRRNDVNEGELSFNSIIRKLLSEKKDNIFKDPIDGASFMLGDQLVQGKPTGLSMDLSKIGSPYLSDFRRFYEYRLSTFNPNF